MDMTIRPRRLRGGETIRKMVRETRMDKSSLIYPLFVKEGENQKEEIPTMPGQFRYSLDRMPEKLEELMKAGVDKVMFFGIPDHKDEVGSQAYAEESVALEETADGYHWQASAIGRIGQVNGPLNSLAKAEPMLALLEKVQNDFDADMSDAWYVISLLYDQLPGNPISFGNDRFAISYIRRCIDTQDNENRLNLTNYLELAQQLEHRNWKADKRAKELDKMEKKYAKETLPTEKMKYYEGRNGRDTMGFCSSVPLGELSDREEAKLVCEYALDVYEAAPSHLPSDTEKAEEIKAFLADLD